MCLSCAARPSHYIPRPCSSLSQLRPKLVRWRGRAQSKPCPPTHTNQPKHKQRLFSPLPGTQRSAGRRMWTASFPSSFAFASRGLHPSTALLSASLDAVLAWSWKVPQCLLCLGKFDKTAGRHGWLRRGFPTHPLSSTIHNVLGGWREEEKG